MCRNTRVDSCAVCDGLEAGDIARCEDHRSFEQCDHCGEFAPRRTLVQERYRTSVFQYCRDCTAGTPGLVTSSPAERGTS